MSGAHDGSVVCATLKPSTPSNGYSQRCGGSIREDWGERSTLPANELLDERQNARRYPRQRDAVQPLGIHVRAGLHTGECEIRGDDIGGIGVHIGARVSALAAPNDVLVSSPLRDLVVGPGLEFEERGPG